MTSLERQSGNIYGGITEPKYSAVSYTWGRWAIPFRNDTPAIKIHGIPWQIPPMEPSYFTVEDFSRMISQTRTATGNRFIWLDVACVEQGGGSPQAVDQIRKRPGIFANASVAFVWLCKIPTHALRNSWNCWEKLLRHQYSDGGLVKDLESMYALEDALRTFLDHPQFSSLWALQDEGLRKDALLLSHEGELAETDTIPCNLYSISLGFSIISSTPSNNSGEPGSPNAQARSIADRIKLLIDNAGVPFPGSSPNVSYIAANKRRSGRPGDLFYVMMGLYDIQINMGIAKDVADPCGDDNSDISDLQEEFAGALNRKSFFLAQLFVHVETPALGKSWQITPTARVPTGFDQWTPGHVTDDCVLDTHPGAPAHVSANITSFECLIKFWKARLKGLSDAERNDQLLVVVDDYLRQTQPAVLTHDSENSASQTASSHFLHTKETVDWLLASFESCRLSVLMLGGLSFRVGLFEEYFGLLILHDEKDRSRCQRIGLCKWEGNDYFTNMGVSEDAKAAMPQFEQRYNGVMS